MTSCPCGASRRYQDCCAPLHQGEILASSPQQLMRSRYCAFVMGHIDYLVITHSPDTRSSISPQSIAQWNSQCDWRGLHIVTRAPDIASNKVEFIAWYKQANKLVYHHELSLFKYQSIDDSLSSSLTDSLCPDNAWYYHSATYPERIVTSPGRNDRCICHSGKKFKQCCAK